VQESASQDKSLLEVGPRFAENSEEAEKEAGMDLQTAASA